MAIKQGHSFPAGFGFTGSCGKQNVRGYQRGGPVLSQKNVPTRNVPLASARKTAPTQPRVSAADAPRGALDNRGPLMPGYQRGGEVAAGSPSTPKTLRRGGRGGDDGC